VFVLYALTLRAPSIQLARQGARTGKILACGHRLCEVLAVGRTNGSSAALAPLRERIQLIGVKLAAGKSRRNRRRLGTLNLAIDAGTRVMIVGATGAGKTTLLEILAGHRTPSRGEIRFDGRVLDADTNGLLADQVYYLGESCTWQRQRLSQFLGVDESARKAEVVKVLKLCRAWKCVVGLRKELKTKVSSFDFSPAERRAFALARALLSGVSVLLLDDSFAELSKNRASVLLSKVLAAKPATTVVYACRKPVAVEHFDRVIHLEQGKVVRDAPSSRSGNNNSMNRGNAT